jgi:hypothetical protein
LLGDNRFQRCTEHRRLSQPNVTPEAANDSPVKATTAPSQITRGRRATALPTRPQIEPSWVPGCRSAGWRPGVGRRFC